MSNLNIYEKVRACPDEALKPILGGKLKGKSDINPMWRIKKLTELFGPCGVGWKTTEESFWTTPGSGGEVIAWCSIKLLWRDSAGVEWSEPVFGIGGAMMVETQRGNLVTNDDAFKMAYTDAISVAAKALGLGADVYFENDKDKYTSEKRSGGEQVQQAPSKPVLSSKGRDWKAAVAFTASQSDSAEVISKKIRSKYDITDDDLELLLKQSGKKS